MFFTYTRNGNLKPIFFSIDVKIKSMQCIIYCRVLDKGARQANGRPSLRTRPVKCCIQAST